MSITKIIFIWNADFSLASGVRALKEAASGEHSCTLCDIAYHRVRQTAEFRDYKKQLAARYSATIKQPCRNQLSAAERAAAGDDFPAVLVERSGRLVKLLGSNEINACDGQFEPFQKALEDSLIRRNASD